LLSVLTDKLQTPEDGRAGRTNYSVLRLKQDILAGSSVGLIAINKQDSDTYHRVGGLNFTFNSGNVLPCTTFGLAPSTRSFKTRIKTEITPGILADVGERRIIVWWGLISTSVSNSILTLAMSDDRAYGKSASKPVRHLFLTSLAFGAYGLVRILPDIED